MNLSFITSRPDFVAEFLVACKQQRRRQCAHPRSLINAFSYSLSAKYVSETRYMFIFHIQLGAIAEQTRLRLAWL